jgi:hypothetical protein
MRQCRPPLSFSPACRIPIDCCFNIAFIPTLSVSRDSLLVGLRMLCGRFGGPQGGCEMTVRFVVEIVIVVIVIFVAVRFFRKRDSPRA